MKHLIIFLFILFETIAAQQIQINGIVLDEENSPLALVNIIIPSSNYGTATSHSGEFQISGDFSLDEKVSFSYIGYQTRIVSISELVKGYNEIILVKKILTSQTVLVEASIAKEGYSPISFSKINRKTIEENYVNQDIPEMLSYLPSTTFYSEGGAGIGYNYLSIRGFDQRRISVAINGIPQNDPEDHNVYWVDFPDLLESTELIQVQRGAGSGVLGYPAIGGSINIITSTFSDKPKVELSSGYGSFNTRKYTASYSSGLINNKYSIYAKLSHLLSDGYRDNSWVDFKSYHVSVVRYDENFTTQINLFGGPIADGLVYLGLPKFTIKNKKLRTANYSDWGVDPINDEYTYNVKRRSVELENFSQPHYELLNEMKINDNVTLNSALFLVIGEGFFDYDAYWHVYYDDYFRFAEDGYDASYIPSNTLIRAQVENTQYGWVPRLSIKHDKGELIFGGELRFHKSNHWGRIQYANNLPPGYDLDRYYYYYNGRKDILSAFVHESYQLNDQINLLGELQLVYNKYKLYNEKFVGTKFDISYFFINPRAGINFKLTQNQNIYFSYARVSREPRLKNYYDAAESNAGKLPQFEQNSDGTYDFENPLVKSETMNDFELGTSISESNFSLSLNLFYMLFDNEIVKNGQVDRFGQPVTGNAKSTIHRGIELTGILKFFNGFEAIANASFSYNKINEGSAFIEFTDPATDEDIVTELDLSGNRISSFPDLIANLGISYKKYGLYLRLTGRYVGEFYSDNYDTKLSEYLKQYPGYVSYDDNKNEAYFTADFYGSYEFKFFDSLAPAKVYLQVSNIFENLYSAYAIGKEFFPAADRYFNAGVKLGL